MATPTPPSQKNRRLFSRVNLDAECRLNLHGREFPVRLIDVSMKGALVQAGDDIPLVVRELARLKIELSDEEHIEMRSRCVHKDGDFFGFYCMNLSLDSMRHLRRLVELNLGDADLAAEEFQRLCYLH